LAERNAIEVQETGSALERKQEQEERRRRDELYSVSEAAAEFFERCLTGHPLASYAQAELAKRELGANRDARMEEVLRAFRVGYAPAGWDELANHLRTKGFNRRAAEVVGLLVQRKSGDGYYDRFRHRLMFAVVDVQGRVIAFSGRSLEEPSAGALANAGSAAKAPAPGGAQQQVAKYMNSPESPIYRKRDNLFGLYQARQAIREKDRGVLVEGNFDVVSLHARGIGNVVAPLGTAFTAEQAQQLRRYSHNVTFLFDGDGAGRRATAAAREPCQAAELVARAARLADGTDPDEMIRRAGPEAVERLLGAAQPLLEYLIDEALRTGFSASDAQARAAKIKEVTDLIEAEKDPNLRAMAERHADAVAGRLGIVRTDDAATDARTFGALRAAVLAAARGKDRTATPARAVAPEQARSPSRIAEIGHQVLGAVLEHPSLLEDPEVAKLLGVVEGDLAVGLLVVQQLGPDLGRLEPAAYAERFPPSLRQQVARRLAAPTLGEAHQARTELLSNLLKLRNQQHKHEQRDAQEELRRAVASGDLDAQLHLLRSRQARAQEIAEAKGGSAPLRRNRGD
jgi:DNA primase